MDVSTEELKKKVVAAIDMSNEASDEELLSLIDRVLQEESRYHYLPLARRIACRKELFNTLRRLDILSEIMDDDTVTEIMVNGPKYIFIERFGRLERFPGNFPSNERLEDVIQQIVGRVNRRVNEASPMVDARLLDGSRVNVVLPPIALDGAILTIRRFSKEPLRMEQLIAWEAISEEGARFLKVLVESGYNIFISGGTGSGKTTFLGALAEFIPTDERVATIEDAAELRLANIQNLVRFEARAANTEGNYEVTIRDLIRNALRIRPDRIIVGEIRAGEALDMLQAMNTGHDGSLSTGHANSAQDMLSRIETMVLTGMELPLAAIRSQIASALDIIVHLERLRDKSRKVVSIDEVMGLKDGMVELSRLFEFREEGEKDGSVKGSLVRTERALIHTHKLNAAGYQLSDIQDEFTGDSLV